MASYDALKRVSVIEFVENNHLTQPYCVCVSVCVVCMCSHKHRLGKPTLDSAHTH